MPTKKVLSKNFQNMLSANGKLNAEKYIKHAEAFFGLPYEQITPQQMAYQLPLPVFMNEKDFCENVAKAIFPHDKRDPNFGYSIYK